jgi:5,10-methylene-tetrahydrofolate dehydrogenase/methenyl tetrahydrofolate cyclohydrolase
MVKDGVVVIDVGITRARRNKGERSLLVTLILKM